MPPPLRPEKPIGRDEDPIRDALSRDRKTWLERMKRDTLAKSA
jgi:hypothetical protein